MAGRVFSLPKTHRLLRGGEFRTLLRRRQASRDRCFSVFYFANVRGHARLGIAVSKRVARLAVRRNRIKRAVRESFRHHHARLDGLDVAVIANPEAGRASAEQLNCSLVTHWDRLEKQCKKSS